LTVIPADKLGTFLTELGKEMSKKLYVGNLSFQTTEKEVTDAFEQCGAVESVSIITDRETGRSKGFGFVVMEEEGADKAISTLHGSQLNGRTLTVNQAKPMVKREFGDRDRGGGRRDRY
jgi:cold-inducible RNA-binding protein